MNPKNEMHVPGYESNGPPVDKASAAGKHAHTIDPEFGTGTVETANLHRKLKGRHMQMIAIGGAIGAGLFVNSGGAFQQGGPASVFLGFLIIGVMVYLMMQAVAELTVLYPVNGAFTMYICRFVDPSFGWACGIEYAISWLTVLPFEISAACNVIHYWQSTRNINDSAWIVPCLVALVVIQIFGVRGYGEVEFVLSIIKVTACVGFMILGIIINTGGVPTDHRGYIGGQYWNAPYQPFLNGFHGFCTVFVSAAFAYTGTELTGLAAAETANPRREIPRASNQVAFRVILFYVVNLLLVGLCLPATSKLYDTTGPASRRSPFVLAIQAANIPVLPDIFNAVIMLSVLSVANSCTFGSTRTLQAMAANEMFPKFMAKIDKKGRPINVIILQLLFGLLAFINLAPNGDVIFSWLLSLSGLTVLFVYAGIGLAHIRFRKAWAANGRSVSELPYKANCGIWGSYICILICVLGLMGQFYVALYPIGGPNLNANVFFQLYLAGPLLVFLYLVWKCYSWFFVPSHRRMWVNLSEIDIYAGMREGHRAYLEGHGDGVMDDEYGSSGLHDEKKGGVKNTLVGIVRSLI